VTIATKVTGFRAVASTIAQQRFEGQEVQAPMTKRSKQASQPFTRRLIQLAVASCFATAVHANPTGPSVVSGAATFDAVGKNLTVTNTPGAIINWQGFSIRADEVTRFVQPGAASAVLNRVTGTEQSALLGQLLSNGRVFLINPNGVTVGAGAVIDTAGFVASSLNLSNEDFLAGKFRFTDPGTAGTVVNGGTINAGSNGTVYLIAPAVENHGLITAPGGEVMLAAGKSVEIVSTASPDLRVQVQAGGEALNVGRLLAESGRVGIYGAAIRNSGTVSADSAQVTAAGTVVLKASGDVTLDATSALTANGAQGGTVTVQAETGTLLADGRVEATGSQSSGGDVKLLGQQVGLVNQASVDASGRTGGGAVLIGGDYQGKNSDVENARATYIGPDATIRADAGATGDGGKVIVWADEGTRFYGAISARGGALGGDGGLVETSGKQVLDAQGTVDASAPAGAAGRWLLDPNNVRIQAAGVDTNVTASPNFTTTNDSAIVTTGSIVTALNAGTSVTVTTANAGANTQVGNITVANAIAMTGAGNAALTLNATNNITFNGGANLTSTVGQLDVNLNAGAGGITNLRAVNTNGGTLTLDSSGPMTQAGVISGAGALVKNGTGTLTLSQANTYTGTTDVQAGTLRLTNASGLGTAAGGTTVDAGATLALNGLTIAGEALTLNGGTLSRAAGNPTWSGTVNLAALSTVDGAAGTLTLGGVVSGAGGLTKTGAGTVTLSGANTYAGPTTVNAGTLTLGANNVLPDTSNVVVNGGTLNVNTRTDTVAGVQLVSGAVTGTTGVLTSASDFDVQSGTVTARLSGGVGLNKTTGGTVTLSGANTYTGATTVSTGTLTVNNASALGTTAGGTTVDAGATLALNNFTVAGEALTLNGGTLSRAAGNPTWSGTVSLAVPSTIDGAAGTLTLSGVVSGAGDLIKTGAGAATLSGNNTYSGNTTVSAGTLTANNANALGAATGGTTVDAGATLALNSFTIAGEALTLNGGTLSRAAGNPTWNGTVDLAASSTVAGGGGTLTLGGVVSGAGDLTKTGAGTVRLSGNNTYSGVTDVQAGTLLVNNANALGSSAGGTMVETGATLALNAFTIAAEALTLNGGTLSRAAGNPTWNGTVDLAATSTVTGAGTLTIGGVVSGAGGLTKTGGGTVVLSGPGANTYAGPTAINAGTLRVGSAANKLPDAGAVTLGGGTLALNGFSETVGSISGTSNITLGAGTLTAGGDNSTTTYSGVISGGGGVVKNGTGTLTLAGANTYTGATTVNAGTLSAANAAALGTTAGGTTINSGATLDIDNVTIGAENVTINGNGVGGTGALTGTGTAVLGGQVTVATGARVGAAAGDSLRLNGTIQGPGGLDVAGGGTVTFANTVGNVTPLASLTSAAGSTLAVNGGLVRTTGAQTYDGSLTTGGATTLQTTNANITANGAVNAIAGTLTLNTGTGNVTMTNAANDFGTVAVTSGNTVALNDANALTLGASSVGTLAATAGGALSVNGALNANGPGNSIVLSGSSFVNNVGAGAVIVPVGGRWIVYSADPAADTFNGLASANQAIWNATFAGNPPGTIPAGNRYVFSSQPTLTFTSTNAAKIYGDLADVSGNYGVSGFVNAATYGNVFTQDTAANALTGIPSVTSAGTPTAADAGLYPITVTVGSLASTTGYALAFNSAGQLTVSPRPITVTPGPLARPYGDPNPATTGTLTVGGSGLVNGNTITQVDVTSPATATDPAGSVHALNGSNAVFGGGGLASNYTITYAAGVLTISARPITVQADDQSRAYGDPNPATGPFTIVTGSLAGTDAIGSVNVTSPATATAPAGSVWVLTNTGANFTSGSAANYTITLQNGQLTISTRPITVTANNQAKVYGQPDPTLTFTAPTVNGDVLNGTPVRVAGETVAGGPYAITQGTVTNAANPNYNITFVNGQLVISPASLTIAADNQARPYGDANPPLTATFTGLTNGDTAAAIPGVAVTTPAVPASNVGSYTINVTSGANSNYTITYANGQLVIVPAPLQIVADDQARPYGQPNPPFTATATGFKLGQTVADLNGNLVLTTPATATSPAGAYPIVPGGVSSTNYTITFVDGILVVGQTLPPADNALVTATGRNLLMGTGTVQPGAVISVDQCQLPTPMPVQAGVLATAQRALDLAAAGRLGAPDCETLKQ
jgi:filamentous hemagglutinin family protein